MKPVLDKFKFSVVPGTGSEHPKPVALGMAFFRGRDAHGLARRIERTASDPLGGLLLQFLKPSPHRHHAQRAPGTRPCAQGEGGRSGWWLFETG